MTGVHARLRQMRNSGDGGFALVFALMITTVVMITITTVMVAVQPGVSGAKRSQDQVAAFIAARSGIDDAIAYLMSIPSCRSESRICPAATQMGDDSSKPVTSDNLAAAGKPRPAMTKTGGADGPYKQFGQSFSWAINQTPTPEGFVRVTSTGTYRPAKDSLAVTKTLVADLALNPSILGYGYYTDYESLSPAFLQSYYNQRSVYISDATTYGNVASTYRGSTTAPRYANWTGPTTAANCGQHWYYESAASPGRASAANNSSYAESGKLGTTTSTTSGTTVSRSGGCDLVFSSSMVQNGKTFTRDAILSGGTGPRFNQPVYTMWGYNDGSKNYTNPAFPAAGQKYRLAQGATAMSNTPNLPQVAQADLVLPTTIGKDGIPENACVFTGPTRVKLNGDGTATVTSPLTRTKNAASDTGCYPANVSAGIVGFKYNYNTVGAGAIVTRNIGTAPTGGWLTNPTKSTNTPAAGNEIFYFNAPGSTDVTAHPDSSTAPYAGCTSTVKYAATVAAACAWTGVGIANDSTSSTGWTTYTKTTCGSTAATNRQLFECEYANLASSGSPAVAQAAGQYKTLRDNVIADLNGNTCLTGTATAQASCVNTIVANRIKVANTGGTVGGTATDGAHRYVATTTAGTPVTTTVATGTTGTGPDGTTADAFFTQPAPAKETVTRTPLTTTVKRQVYSSNAWGSDVPAFTFTTTQSDYTYTAPRGMTYFPNEQDVTAYNTGADSAGTATRGTASTPVSGDRQPGDLYIDGQNKGKLSVLADSDVIVTGDIKNPANYTPATDAVSITAGQDVRNYHPVKCLDQDTTDITNTTSGWCPNDITGLSTSSFISGTAYTAAAPAEQYVNMLPAGDRAIQAAVFALSGSFGTDNYNRGDAVGDLNILGGLYQSHRGGNGVVSGATELSGTTLQYTYVDLQRAELPYVPSTTSGDDVRPWNVVSISPG